MKIGTTHKPRKPPDKSRKRRNRWKFWTMTFTSYHACTNYPINPHYEYTTSVFRRPHRPLLMPYERRRALKEYRSAFPYLKLPLPAPNPRKTEGADYSLPSAIEHELRPPWWHLSPTSPSMQGPYPVWKQRLAAMVHARPISPVTSQDTSRKREGVACIPINGCDPSIIMPPATITCEYVDPDIWETEGDTCIATTVQDPLAQTAKAMKLSSEMPALWEALDSPHIAEFGDKTRRVGVDNRCSLCISGFLEDFDQDSLQPCSQTVEGFSGENSTATQHGTITWTVNTNQGTTHDFIMQRSLYVPGCKQRLFSPQHWAQCNAVPSPHGDDPGPICVTTQDRVVLYWDHLRSSITVPRDRQNCFTFGLSSDFDAFQAYCSTTSYNPWEHDDDPPTYLVHDSIVAGAETTNISEGDTSKPDDTENAIHPGDLLPEQIDMFDIHAGAPASDSETEHSETHLDGMRENPSAELLRYHYKYNHISFRRLQEMAKTHVLPTRLSRCPIPHCASCSCGQATKRAKQTKTQHSINPAREVKLPGDCVSVDVLVTTTPGLIAQMSGFLTRQRYKYACVFVDHASDFGYAHLLREQTADALIETKEAFEEYARSVSVDIKHYHADNGIFASKKWKQACTNARQGLTCAGVNSHHQNGRAERRIRSLQDQARTNLIHGNARWPDAVTPNLWPYAIRASNEVLNNTPNARHKYKHTPMQIFARTRVDANPKHQIPMFCPTCVLDSKLQGNTRIDKWKSRARLGMYLGQSPMHARSIALALDIRTGRVSPQFHVCFDPSFSSVAPDSGNNVPESLWRVAAGFERGKSKYQLFDRAGTDQEPTFAGDSDGPSTMQEVGEPPVTEPEDVAGHDGTSQETEGVTDVPNTRITEESDQQQGTTHTDTSEGTRRSRRSTAGKSGPKFMEIYSELGSNQASTATTEEIEGAIFGNSSPCAFAASADPDTMYYHEAMKQPDADQFKEAARSEFDDTLNKGILKLIDMSEVPDGSKIFKSVWAMKRKRRIMSQEVYKWKARLNFDGSKQIKDEDYDQSYAPVATWESIRILLALVLRNKWHTLQLDYVQAYPQAPAERDYYMEIPPGMEGTETQGKVLKVEKNICGQVQASRVWNQYLVEKLKSIGFKQSEHDECVFCKGNALCVLCTDDSILAGPDKNELEAIHEEMKSTGLDMTKEEGGLSDFLGVNIERIDDTTYHLSQPHLIQKILDDLGLSGENVAIKDTPAQTSKVLSAHRESEDFDQHFHYRSIIGKLNHLERCTRPDIAHACHQCARYSASPKKEHGAAVKWLGRYLRGTKDKGIFLNLKDENFQVWADADFAGNWLAEDAVWDKDTARSRSGFIIKYLGVPILWKSQLQDTISLSTTEAEYICLSQALHRTIPIVRLIQEMSHCGVPVGSTKPTMLCKAFQDNTGALSLAKLPSMRPRTKYLNCKYHHFRSFVGNMIDIEYCNTDDMSADTLTKPNPAPTLQKHRFSIMGW